MKSSQLALMFAIALTLVLSMGCASTKITGQQSMIGFEILPSPGKIIVHDFAVSIADLPPGSALVDVGTEPEKPMTEEQQKAAQELGVAVAKELVKEINGMAMLAVRAADATEPQINDLAIYGAFISVDAGSGFERVVVGFGVGDAALKTFVEAFQMTETGMRRLGSAELDTTGGKSPGVAVPVIVTIATANPIGIIVGAPIKAYGELTGSSKLKGAGKRTAKAIAKELKARFTQQGWISDS